MVSIDNKKLTISVFAIFVACSVGLRAWQNSNIIWKIYNSQEPFIMHAIFGSLVDSAITVLCIIMLWRIFFVAHDRLLKKITLIWAILSIIHLLLSAVFYSDIIKKVNALNTLHLQTLASDEILSKENQEIIEDINES